MRSDRLSPWRLASGLALLGCFGSLTAQAATLDVRPTLLQLLPGQKVGVLNLINQDDAPHTYQIKCLRWSPDGKEQKQDPTDDIIANPAIVTLPAHQTQIVRYGTRDAVAVPERAYRLIVDEVPGEQQATGSSLNVLLRVSLPLFVRDVVTLPKPDIGAGWKGTDQTLTVSLANHGKYTVRIVKADIAGGGAPAGLSVDQLHYVLPGGVTDLLFKLPKPWAPHGGTVTLMTDAGDVAVPLGAGN